MTTKKRASRVGRKRKVRRRQHGESVLDPANPDAVAVSLYGRDKQPDKSRLNDEWVHVSNLIHGGCLRAKLIACRSSIEHVNIPRPSDRLLWRIGRAVEAHIRESMIAIYGMENCLGVWECRCGFTAHRGFGDAEKRCDRCKGRVDDYGEYQARDLDTMLTGSPDLLVRAESGKLVVFEIKSIKYKANSAAPAFENIETPIRAHQLQALMYQRMLSLGHEVAEEVCILYGAKDYMMKSPYKVFSVDSSEDPNVHAVDSLYGFAREYADAKRSGDLLPKLPCCSTPKALQARECLCVVPCFEMDD